MQSTQLDVLAGAQASLQQGHAVTLVSVARTWGSSPRPVGALLAVSSSGAFFGSVSGGCVEDDLIENLVREPVGHPRLIKYGETDEQRQQFGLPCGGTLELMLEPLSDIVDIGILISAIEQRQALTRVTHLQSGGVQSHECKPTDEPQLTDDSWINVFGPVWRLLIIGAGQTSRYLAEMAQALGYAVVISDPRPEYQRGWDLDTAPILSGYPDDVVAKLKPDSRTAIVALSHDPRLDDVALMESLRSEAFYVGALGSQRNNDKRRQRLIEHLGFSQTEVDRLHGPVGLPIGSKTPPEIALSVLAEITALRNGFDGIQRQ